MAKNRIVSCIVSGARVSENRLREIGTAVTHAARRMLESRKQFMDVNMRGFQFSISSHLNTVGHSALFTATVSCGRNELTMTITINTIHILAKSIEHLVWKSDSVSRKLRTVLKNAHRAPNWT